jgi:hypothetical protein
MIPSRVVNRVCTGVIAGCVGVLAVTASLLAVPPWRAYFVEEAQPSYPAGTSIDVSAELYRDANRTLVVFAHGHCAAAIKAQPQLQELVSTFIAQTGGQAVLLVPSDADREADNLAFAEEMGMEAGAVHATDFRLLRLRAVPTAVVVDRTGRVLATQEGFVTDTDVRALLAAMPGAADSDRTF